jgi:hypothetical protein
MCRAAQRLTTSPSTSFDELARELRVGERYLSSGLRAMLGVDPTRLAELQSGDQPLARLSASAQD